MSDNISLALDHRPILAEVARLARRIYTSVHPNQLAPTEALQLLSVLTTITDRLDAEQAGDQEHES
jgi:hypothetical protein